MLEEIYKRCVFQIKFMHFFQHAPKKKTKEDTAILLVSNFILELVELLHSSLRLSNCRSRRSSSIMSVLLTRTNTYWCKIDRLISFSFTRTSNLAIMLQSALRASTSSETRGNMSSKPCKHIKSGHIQSITSNPVEALIRWETFTTYPVISPKQDPVHQTEYLQVKLKQLHKSWQSASKK